MSRVNLSAQGYRCQEFTGYDWNMVTDDNSKRGKGPFEYHTGGVCCTEVEVDVLTGDHTVRRVDIVMDIGYSVNPVIDVGQVEGAFTQGMGWSTIEEVVWGDSAHPWVRPGQLFTRGPGEHHQLCYQVCVDSNKLPGVCNRHVQAAHLQRHTCGFPCLAAAQCSEPPRYLLVQGDWRTTIVFGLHRRVCHRVSSGLMTVCVGVLTSVFGVLLLCSDAVRSARRDRGVAAPIVLDLPVTVERIRMSCPDEFVERVVGGKDAAESVTVLSRC